MAEAEADAEFDALRSASGRSSRHQVFAGDAEIDRADADFAGDFGGRQEGDLDIVQAFDAAAIGAVVADGDDLHAGAFEDRRGVVLHPALGGKRDGDVIRRLPSRLRCGRARARSRRPGMRSFGAEQRQHPVEAAAAGQHRGEPSTVTSKTRPV